MCEILIYIETFENKIKKSSYDLISGVKKKSTNAKVSGVLVLHPGFILSDETKNELNRFGLDYLYILKNPAPCYDLRLEPYLIFELIKLKNPQIFLLNSTDAGRETAPVLAALLDTGLTADCTAIEISDEENGLKLVSTRPTFGGKLKASIISKKNPQMATIREGTFKREVIKTEYCLNIEEFNFNVQNKFKAQILDYKKEELFSVLNLQNAKIVLSGGMGLKNKENFDKLKLLAEKTGAVVGATRKAVDKGLIEKEYQIGQTGECVSPDLYVAFGISGAIHHISGMENSKKIIAINTDKNAQIFNHADIGIVDDAVMVLEKLLAKLN